MNPATRHAARCALTDALKGFAIACVVMGHSVLRTVPEPSSNVLYLTLTAFEMPLFMFLSGYVLPGRVRAPRWRWTVQRAARLMVPFFAWQTIFFLSRRIGSASDATAIETVAGLGRSLLRAIETPAIGLWYLPALVICSALLALLYPLRTKPLLVAALGWIALEALMRLRSGAGISADFGLAKANTHWLFFAAGFGYAQVGRDVRLTAPLRGAIFLAFPLFAAPALTAALDAGGAVAKWGKVVLGLFGTGFSVVLINLAEKAALAVRLDVLGRLTLGVYCSHWLFLRADFGDGAVGLIGRFAFTLACSTALSWAITKWAPARAVLLGEWPRYVASARS